MSRCDKYRTHVHVHDTDDTTADLAASQILRYMCLFCGDALRCAVRVCAQLAPSCTQKFNICRNVIKRSKLEEQSVSEWLNVYYENQFVIHIHHIFIDISAGITCSCGPV